MSAVQTSTYLFMFRYMLNHFEFPAPIKLDDMVTNPRSLTFTLRKKEVSVVFTLELNEEHRFHQVSVGKSSITNVFTLAEGSSLELLTLAGIHHYIATILVPLFQTPACLLYALDTFSKTGELSTYKEGKNVELLLFLEGIDVDPDSISYSPQFMSALSAVRKHYQGRIADLSKSDRHPLEC